MHARTSVALIVLSCLLACRHADGYAGDGFGAVLTPTLGVNSDHSAVAMDSSSDEKPTENAYMRVRAYENPTATGTFVEWKGDTFFYDDPPELTAVGVRTGTGWVFNKKSGASLKVESDAKGQTGQTLADWAPKNARYIVVRIVPRARKKEVLHADDGALIEMEAELIIAGSKKRSDPPNTTTDKAPRTGAQNYEADDGSNAQTEGTRNATTGSDDGMIGADSDKHHGFGKEQRIGSAKGVSGNGSPKGQRHGSTKKHGGVRADGSVGGVRHGEVYGAKGGSGDPDDDGVSSGGPIEIFGLVIGGWIAVPAALKPAVDVANVLGQNISPGSLVKQFRGFAAARNVPALRTEIASTMRTDLAKNFDEMAANVNANKGMPAAQKKALIRRTKHLACREYFERLERGARAEIKRLAKELRKRKNKHSKVDLHHIEVLQGQLDAAKKLEKAARVKPIKGKLSSNHAYAGGAMPSPKKLHAQYGTHLPFTEDGFPDFSNVFKHKATIKFQGRRGLDEKSANAAVNIRGTPDGWTWHHHQDGKTMLLVPTPLHELVGHHGGFSLYKAELGI